MKRAFISILFLCFSVITSFAGDGRFQVLRGASQSILAAFYDRDSALLYTYDKAGAIITWDATNMYPIRSFNTVPFNIWRETQDFELSDPVLGVTNNRIWLIEQMSSGSGKNGVFDGYYKNGQHFAQSDTTGTVDRLWLLKNNNDVLMTRSSDMPQYTDGKLSYGVLIYYNSTANTTKRLSLPAVATAIQVSDDERYVAVGYRNGGVDVFTVADQQKVLSASAPKNEVIDEVSRIRFLKNNTGIVFTYKFSGSQHIYVQYMNTAEPVVITPSSDEMNLKVEISPSGRYMAIYNRFWAGMYDLETKKFEKEDIGKAFGGGMLNTLIFLTDETLLFTGSAFFADKHIYAVKLNDVASVMRVNWRTNDRSANRSFDVQTRSILQGDLGAVNDSVFRLSLPLQYVQYIQPARLSDIFCGADASPVINDDVQGGMVRKIFKTATEFTLQETKLNTGRVEESLPIHAIQDYQPIKVHSGAKLILWKADMGLRIAYLVSNYKGDVLLRDTCDNLSLQSVLFSPDGKWLCMLPDATSIKIYSTAGFKKLRLIKTGLANTVYMPEKLQFNSASTRLAWQQFSMANLNSFTLVTTELSTGKTDTVRSYAIKPYAFSLSPDFGKLALSLPLNITDTALFNNAKRAGTAAAYGFRNEFDPIILFIDLKTDAYSVFKVKGKMQVSRLAATSHGVAALQNDGLLYHYFAADTGHVLAQWLYGPDFAVIDRDDYYATKGAIDRVSENLGNSFYPVGGQDIFYNRPAEIMKALGNRNAALVSMYEQAYKKRIAQYPGTSAEATSVHQPQVYVDPSVSGRFVTTDSVLKVPVKFGEADHITQLNVTVNGSSVYGRHGLAVQAGQKDVTLNIPLEKGENDIRIQAIDADGFFATPVLLSYTADYTEVKQKKKLWILAAGVSRYKDSVFNLKYAAKDAGDFTKVFAYKDNYDTIIVKTLVNEEVTTGAIMNELQKARSLGKEDVVLVYLAGHGLLDNNAGFYYATHDIDFQNPAVNGLSYTQLLGALEELPSVNKALFLDACHSGVVDKSKFKPATVPSGAAAGHVVAQNTRGLTVAGTGGGTSEQDVFLFMKQVFSDLSQDNNVTVLAASLGNSYALENDKLQNGLFTYCLIKGIGLAKAQPSVEGYQAAFTTDAGKRKYGEGSLVSIKDIERYVADEVTRLSDGRQVPDCSLSGNAANILFNESSFATYIYDTDYKPADMKDYQPGRETLYRIFLDRYKEADNNK